MKIVNKSIIDYWRKDVNMRLLIEKSCKNVDNALIVKRLEALKAIIAFYNTTHTDLIAKEIHEHKNKQEYEHCANI